MITGIMLWNEPNNLSHWDFQMDPEWRRFSAMIVGAARAIKELAPQVRLVLGGISPIDPNFIKLLTSYGALENLDAVGVHGFSLDWNHWKIDDWPRKIQEIEDICPLPASAYYMKHPPVQMKDVEASEEVERFLSGLAGPSRLSPYEEPKAAPMQLRIAD